MRVQFARFPVSSNGFETWKLCSFDVLTRVRPDCVTYCVMQRGARPHCDAWREMAEEGRRRGWCALRRRTRRASSTKVGGGEGAILPRESIIGTAQSIIRILAYYCHLRVPFFSVISHFRMHWIHFCFSREDDTLPESIFYANMRRGEEKKGWMRGFVGKLVFI